MKRSIVLRGQRVEYEFEQKSIRRINYRIRADGSLYVSAPRLAPIAMVEAKMIARADWILEHLRRRERELKESGAREEAVWFRGERLRVQLCSGARASAVLQGLDLQLTLRDPDDPEERRRVLENWQKRVCSEQVIALCRRYYPAFQRRGVAYPTLSFRRMKSRWGSCRPQRGALSFNTRLAELPPDCVDYIVVHEFAHFLQPNHSAAFYAEVERVLPDWKGRKSRLRAWELSHPL